MTFLESENSFVLSTGTKVYCYEGTMCPDDRGKLVYGSDGHVVEEPDLTRGERHEIAEHFIARWRAWVAATSEGT